jgi:CRP/FNR family transcriptional regulator, cyclic AMP receptor protein
VPGARRGRLRVIPDDTTIRLLDADPDIGRYLGDQERHEAAALTVPCVALAPGPLDVPRLLARHSCFGALVVDGMLACHMRVGEQAGMRILGPGDMVSAGAPPSMLLAEYGCRVAAPTRLAMLGKDVLLGSHRWPRLFAGLHARSGEQVERLAVQLAICQLPRVEERLLALFWLLAESWGRVTTAGTVLPLSLTHETLGALVGARRPTVTLALGELASRGAVLRQEKAWLLMEYLPEPAADGEVPHAPGLVSVHDTVWTGREPGLVAPHDPHDEIADTVRRLQSEHAARADRVREGLQRVRDARARSRILRERVAESRRVRPPRAPS